MKYSEHGKIEIFINKIVFMQSKRESSINTIRESSINTISTFYAIHKQYLVCDEKNLANKTQG